MVVVGAGSTERTYLQAVNRLLAADGENEIGSLSGPSRRIANAMRAVEDARKQIFYKKLWEWRRGFMEFSLVADQMWYELPDDYHKLGGPISRNDRNLTIPYMNFDNLVANWPELRIFPPGSGIGGVGPAVQAAGQTLNFGAPEVCTVWSGYIGFMPVPDDDFVDLEDGKLYGTYWTGAVPLVSDNDSLGLPQNLWEAHHLIALGHFKKFMEAPDWQADIVLGRQLLSGEVASRHEDEDRDIYYKASANYNE